jgi:YD repeat-containing protein
MMLGTAAGAFDRWKLHNQHPVTGNNGNVQWQTITAPGMAELTQAYSYDAVNRLEIAAEYNSAVTTPSCPDAGSQWCQKFGYDRYGNRTIAARTNIGVSPLEPNSYNAANNRIADAGWAYDGSGRGNITADPAGGSFGYDAEDRLISANGTVYAYDGEGRRVKRVLAGSGRTTIFVYDASGQLVAEYTTGAPPTAATSAHERGECCGLATDQRSWRLSSAAL